MLISQLHSAFCNYQSTFKNNTPRTISWLHDICHYFIKQTHTLHIEDVNIKVIKQWFMEGKITKQWSAKTIRNRMSALSIFFDWCVAEQYLEDNPIK